MIYVMVAILTLISIAVIILLFDHHLYARFFAKIFRVIPKFQFKLISINTHNVKQRLKTATRKTRIPVIPVLSILVILSTGGLCYFLITHNSLAVYHSQGDFTATTNTQVTQLLLGERLSPPPAPPEELFAELEAEVASYQALQTEPDYWPEATTENPSQPPPMMLPEPDLSELNAQDHTRGYSGDMLATHLNNGHINIKNADRNWEKMNSEFVQRMLSVYKVMKDQYGYDMVLLEGYRSPDRQARLLKKGTHVTNAGAYKSYHQFGLAGDSAFIRNGKIVISEKDPWAMQGYRLYGKVAKSAGLVWGGDWRMMDLGHIELRKKGVLGRPDMAELLTRQ